MNARIAFVSLNNACSDRNIQSALFLLAYENRFGDPAEARIHLDGLRKWVEQRGGLDNFEEHFTLGPQLRWMEMTGTAILVLDCGPDCANTLVVSSLGVLDTITLNNTIVRVATVQLPDLCQMFIDFFGLFRSEAHYRILRQIFRPAGHLSLVYASVLQDHPPRFLLPPLPEREDMLPAVGEAESSTAAQNRPAVAMRRQLWSEASSQCRLACLFFVNACICTSRSRTEAESLLSDMVELTEKDYPTSDSTIGLLWTFAYAMQLENAANVEANRIVLQMLNAARRLRPRSRAKIEDLLIQLLFYPLEYSQIDSQVDDLGLFDEIMQASEVVALAPRLPIGPAG
jgi:hypothetical protein